ncbi:MAG: helix-turn-helix domain-containing protein [Candidatus Aenigmarchaeota archaeon]|nr:helix-turn-helix domain-containing protein [Candidatus Aenigmarchaeota archaeon]
MKDLLTQQVAETLLKNDFKVFLTRGIFDVAGKREEERLLIKTLMNIDGFLKEHASSLRALSNLLPAIPLVVSVKTNRFPLMDGIVYSRFNIPVITPSTLEELLFEDRIPYVYSVKGKHLVVIDTQRMRQQRKKMKMSMKTLARKAEISIKAVYEIETNRVNPTLSTAKRLEEILGIRLILSYDIRSSSNHGKVKNNLKPKTELQRCVITKLRQIGIEATCIYNPRLNVVGKQRNLLASCVKNEEKNLKDEARFLKEFKDFFDCESVIILEKGKGEKKIYDIPVLEIDKLKEIKKANELFRLIKEKSE